MQVFAKLLVCALALAAVTADAADTIRKGCDDAGADLTPLPTTGKPEPTTPLPSTGKPDQTTPAPTTGKPDQTTPAPTTGKPDQTTPAPTTGKPEPTTPEVTTGKPEPTTPEPTTPEPTTPEPTTPEPTTPEVTTPAPGMFDPYMEYLAEGRDCQGYLRLPRPGFEISQEDCVLPYNVKFTEADTKLTAGCVVCEAKWGGKFVYDNSTDLAKQTVPLCAGKPLCTRFGGYTDLTEYDLMCVLRENGGSPIEDPKGCAFGDN